MANVNIYPRHKDILDSLISSAKVGSSAGATKTGPFKAYRDAYVFAASIGLAAAAPTPTAKMPKSKSQVIAIKDHILLGAHGATELSYAVVLVEEDDGQLIEDSLRKQLDLIMDDALPARLGILDRYAHAGFEWLMENEKDESSVRDLVLAAIDRVECIQTDPDETPLVRDPLLDVLLD